MADDSARPIRRRIGRLVRRFFIVLAVWMSVSWVVAYQLTRRRHAVFQEPAPTVTWGEVESLRLRSRDGLDLGAWWIEGKRDAPAVLILHGNGGSRRNCIRRAEMLAAAGYPSLLVSLRAHGDSAGSYNDFGYGAADDVVAAVEYLERRRPGRPIVILGTSLGGAAALFASKELGGRVRGYILESPYLDLRTAVWNRLDDTLPPLLDGLAYRGLLAVVPPILPHLDRISPVEAIRGVPDDVPVLILAGADDRRARPEEAEAIFDRVRSHGTLEIFAGADHLRMIETQPSRYREAVLGLIERATAPTPML